MLKYLLFYFKFFFILLFKSEHPVDVCVFYKFHSRRFRGLSRILVPRDIGSDKAENHSFRRKWVFGGWSLLVPLLRTACWLAGDFKVCPPPDLHLCLAAVFNSEVRSLEAHCGLASKPCPQHSSVRLPYLIFNCSGTSEGKKTKDVLYQHSRLGKMQFADSSSSVS